MKRSFVAAVLVAGVALAAPRVARAQHTAPAGSSSAGTAVPAGGSSSGGSSSISSSSSSSSGASSDSGNSGRSFDSGGHRGSGTPNGRAVPRSGRSGGGAITIGGGFDPFGYTAGGGFGLGIYDGFYGGYYGAYDPWYGFAPVYAPSSTSNSDESGAIRLKVKPSDASVYVDGYFAGVVDDFDGVFQRLHLSPGPHRLEFRAANYSPSSVDVWITQDLTITYHAALTK